MNLSVKKMSDEDIPFIHHVFEQNRAVLHGSYISLEEWAKYLTGTDTSGGGDPYESHHIIMTDTTPVAWLKIHSWNKPEICISMLVVDDLFKHKGVGRFAIQCAENMARYWAKSAIRVQTTKDNTIAMECYLKCGYEIIREIVYKVGDGVDREGYEFKKTILPNALTEDNLKNALSKMFNTQIVRVDFESKQLQGGTVGDVRLVTGFAETSDGEKLPYKIILKVQKKWERQDDPDSWRREYDLYKSDLGTLFTDFLRWPECYHAEMNEENNETQLWMEYIDGISGRDLTIEMREHAALELGRFQGRIYKHNFTLLQNISCFSKLEIVTDYYMSIYWETAEYHYIRSDECEIPAHIKQMFITIDNQRKTILENIPVILCHRDFWFENIFYSNAKIRLIDWDSSGWGYIGDDIVQLITDETDGKYFDGYCGKFIPAYIKGFSEYADISWVDNFYIWERIVIHFGYSLAKDYMNAESTDEKKSTIDTLQKIYEMRKIQWN